MSDDSDPTPSYAHLSKDDYRIIVTWIEVPAHFQAFTGIPAKARDDDTPKIKKKDAFNALAKHLLKYTTNSSLKALSGRNMQQRWRTYMQRYYKTLKASKNTLEVSGKDRRKGILSVQEKLEVMCPQFSRMKALFGEKPSAAKELDASSSLNQGHQDENSGDSDSEADCSDGATSAERGENTEIAPAIAESQSQLAPMSSASADRLTTKEVLVEEPSKEQRSPSEQQLSGAKRTPTSLHSSPQSSKRHKNADTVQKKQRQTTHEAQHQTVSAKDDYRYLMEKLEEEKRQWNEKLEVEKALWEADIDFRQQELDEQRAEREEEKRRWDENQKAEKLQREAEAEYRRLELEEQRAKRQQELLLELLRQNKSAEDISFFMSKFGS